MLFLLLFSLAAQAKTLYVDAGSGLQILADIAPGRSVPPGSTILWDEAIDGSLPNTCCVLDAMVVGTDGKGNKTLTVDATLQQNKLAAEAALRTQRANNATRLPILLGKLKDDSITLIELRELLRIRFGAQ